MSIRTSNQIARKCNRLLPQRYGASNNKSIGTDDPNTLTGTLLGRKAAHGMTGNQCILSLEMGTLGAAVTITLWLFSPASNSWVRAGANSTQYSKSFDSKTMDAWNVPENMPYYFQGSAEVTSAYTDSSTDAVGN